MRTNETLQILLDYFQTLEDKEVHFEEEAIVTAYENKNANQSAIKVLSIFGGLLASIAFLGFLVIAGLHNYAVGLLILGAVLIAGAIYISRNYDNVITDTVSVSSFIIGFILITFGLNELNITGNAISILYIFIALFSLVLVQNYILSFISVLVINGSILALIILNNGYNLIQIYVSALALATTYFIIREAKIIKANTTWSRLYEPLRPGLIFSFLTGLIFLGKEGILPVSPDYIWMSTIVILSAIIYLLSGLFQTLNITNTKHKAGIYISCVLLLLPTVLSPAISGSILIILLSFYVNYKPGFVIGAISFAYFISQYYYDLNFTLLTKSILLFSSGVLFTGLYFITRKQLRFHETL